MRNLILTVVVVLFSASAAEPNLEALYGGFRNPPAAYSISPYWFWNGRITPQETQRQIGEMVKQGVHAVVVMNWAGLEPAYLSEAYWQQVGAALEAARSAGLTLNFADEFLWPSGQAWDWSSLRREPSRVLQQHPEFRMLRLTCRQIPPDSSVEPGPGAEVVVSARVGSEGEIDEPSLTLQPAGGAGLTRFVYTLAAAEERSMRVDPLNPAAVRAFIGLVYEEFARRFPRHLGSTIRFFVSDHEGSYGAALPYTPALWETFQQRHGYDLRRFLPLLPRGTPRAARVRQDYLDTISHLYATSFVGQVTEWCTRHGVEHGHSDIEESLRLQVMWTGDMFRLWRASTAPYIDALIERGRMPVDFKEAISVAHFEHRPLMVENQGLHGHDSYWSLEKARLGTNMCLLWGANRLISHYFAYDGAHVQYPPSTFLTQPLWRYYRHYADLVRRAQFMNAQGRHNADIAIYYPLESAFANSAGIFKEGRREPMRWGNIMDQAQDYYSALQLELARQGWDYHIIDSHYIAQASVSGPALELAGERFGVLILPPMTHVADGAAEQIRRFASAGGMILALGPQPPALGGVAMKRFAIRDHTLFMDRLDYAKQIQVPEEVREDLAPLLDTLRARRARDVEIVSGSRDHLYFTRRFISDAEWYWAVNDTASSRRVTVRFASPGVFEKWDAETGRRWTLNANGPEVTLDFGPWDAYFVVRHGGSPGAPALPDGRRRLLAELPGSGWQFTPEASVRVPYATVEGSAEPVWLAPERLANRNWWLAGPYPDSDHQGLFDVFPPETGFDAKDPAWKWYESPTAAVRPPARIGVHYAYVDVWSPSARPGQLAVAVADSLKLWWNGELRLTAHLHPPFVNLRDPWSYRCPVEIRQGWNAVLIKIGPSHAGPTGFLFRITDARGDTLRDVIYSRDRNLPARSSRRVRLTVTAPPGTAGPSVDRVVEEQAIPERAFVFTPRTAPFSLASWTDSTLANYSGTALYETTFDLPEAPAGERVLLDLGEVGLAAEVWINGHNAGERAWRPFEFEITPHVIAGRNRLRVRVANSDAGWMAQGDPIYERGAWGVKFASERDRLRTLHPNGLEGPVRIFAATR